jgi:NDP-mannose synthase
MSKRAIILAGGKGTRLKPYTVALPKPLVPIGETPILEIIINQLKNFGFSEITITLNYFTDIIKAYFGDGSKYGVNIDYSYEEKPLSTMGPLTLINDLPENFLILNGDVLTDLNFGDFFDFHINHNGTFTISSFVRIEKVDYGVLKVNNDGILLNFEEKPVNQYDVSMGIYAANRKILDYIPHNTYYGFDNLVFDLLNRNTPPFIKKHEGYWLDIGRPDDYEAAQNDYKTIFNKEITENEL